MKWICAFFVCLTVSIAAWGKERESFGSETLKYMMYVATWENNVVELIEEMIQAQAIQPNTILYLAFANYDSDLNASDAIAGISLFEEEIRKVADMVHEQGAKVGLSIGGENPRYQYYGSPMYGRSDLVASYIHKMVERFGLDAIDFDVEPIRTQIPSDFVHQMAEVILSLRTLNPELYIHVSLDSQGWAPGDFQQPLLSLCIDAVDSFSSLEWDLWIDPKKSYLEQIQWNIQYYMKEWKIPPHKITLGLMPGLDNTFRNLSLADALDLCQFAADLKLHGILIWDADNDSKGISECLPFSFTKAIQSELKTHITPSN